MRLLLLITGLAFLTNTATATTYTATTNSRADILAAYALCGDGVGDVLAIPAGTNLWQGKWSITKAITIQGAGIGSTIIYDENIDPANEELISWTVSAGKSYRMTGIEFRGSRRNITGDSAADIITVDVAHNFAVNDPIIVGSLVGGTGLSGATYYVKTVPSSTTLTLAASVGGAQVDFTTDITSGRIARYRSQGTGWDQYVFLIAGTSSAVRIDNCKFLSLRSENFGWFDAFGVFDHCDFVLDAGSFRAVMFNHRKVFGSTDTTGDASWENAVVFGGPNTLYFEDCTVSKTATNASGIYGLNDSINGGGRMALRNNIFTNTRLGNHGTESSQRYRGGRSMEVYRNTFDAWFSPTSTVDTLVQMRSGTIYGWGNKFTGTFNSAIKMTSYRETGPFPPWGQADGTKLWDTPDLTDGAGTPGGAGDGVFESGAAGTVTGGSNSLTDSSKAWTTNQWTGHILRQIATFTATSGGTRSAVVSGAGWTTNQWAGWEYTKDSDNSKSYVQSNTSDTLTLSTSYYAVSMTGGGAFTLSKAARISTNNGTVISTDSDIEGGARVFKTGYDYEIRKNSIVLDDSGTGITTAISGSPANHQSLAQTISDPCYFFDNLRRPTPATNWSSGTAAVISNSGYRPLQRNRNYFDDTGATFDGSLSAGKASTKVGTLAARPSSGLTAGVGYWATDAGEWDSTNGATADGQLYVATGPTTWALYYTPYTYPHPLAASAPSITSAVVNGTTLSLVFNKSVTGVSAADFALSGSTLSAATGSGASWSMTISPTTEYGTTYTLNYTAGGVTDGSIPMASFSGLVPTNNNSVPSVRNPGRSNVKKGLF